MNASGALEPLPGGRLLVAVGPSPASARLIQWAQRLAAGRGASWAAVNVEPARGLSAAARQSVESHLALARDLGAEVVVVQDENLAAALLRTARLHQAGEIVVGHSLRHRWLSLLTGGSLADRLIRAGQASVICGAAPDTVRGSGARRAEWGSEASANPREYLEVVLALAAVSAGGWYLAPHAGYVAIGMIYLLAVIALGLRVGRKPVLAAGILSALAWDYLFIPPLFTFTIGTFDDRVLFGSYFLAALITGQLASRVKAQERNERARERRATALLQLTRGLNGAQTLEDGIDAAQRLTDAVFSARSVLLLANEAGSLAAVVPGLFTPDAAERSAAAWAWQNRRCAGRFTAAVPKVEGFYVPLVREERALGVLAIRVEAEEALGADQRELAGSFAAQVAIFAETEKLRHPAAI